MNILEVDVATLAGIFEQRIVLAGVVHDPAPPTGGNVELTTTDAVDVGLVPPGPEHVIL